MVAVAVAAVPTPTPIEGGELILIVADPLYPEPPFVISNEDIAVSYTHLTLPTKA